jgi:regulator of sirC expression with transglutaminase-like and TPR domain
MVRTRAQAIRTLLRDEDPIVVAALRGQLQADAELLDEVWSDSCRAGDPCPPVADLLLSRDGADLVRRYALANDLEQGMHVLSELHLPRFDHAAYCRERLEALDANIPPDASAVQIAEEFCFGAGFQGDNDDYHHPANSFLTSVLQRRKGLPITLTAIWLLLCRRHGLDAGAIALPGHVLGRSDGVYIDLFQNARQISLKNILERYGSLRREQLEALLEPASDRIMLARMARNLVTSYHILRDEQRMHLARQLSHRAMALVTT